MIAPYQLGKSWRSRVALVWLFAFPKARSTDFIAAWQISALIWSRYGWFWIRR
jgi:hypothetical protein